LKAVGEQSNNIFLAVEITVEPHKYKTGEERTTEAEPHKKNFGPKKLLFHNFLSVKTVAV
jgi:hypothetical protein